MAVHDDAQASDERSTDSPAEGSRNGRATEAEHPPPNPTGSDHNDDDDDNEPDNADTEDSAQAEQGKKAGDGDPPGGFDATPLPDAPAGYTLKITLHRAEQLPMADLNTFSSDPYVLSELTTNLSRRHSEDPPLRNRTVTVRRNVNPTWEADWIVANVPASGFRLKCRLYDEDAGVHDQRLGNVHVDVPALGPDWPGITQQPFRIKKRMGSTRAYLIRALATAVRLRGTMSGTLVISVQMHGRSDAANAGRVYTVGPCSWTRHYGPTLGRIVGKKAPDPESKPDPLAAEEQKERVEKYNFQAIQIQLHGPVPAELYHRYVEFKGFVKPMFTHSGIRGFFLHKVLSHQHQHVYHYDRNTQFGYLPLEPTRESALKFLELVDYDRGGRIFTYILTLDALWRFTETGHQFGINMLSKHTLHSDVSIYVAFAGEFLVRRLEQPHEKPPEEGGDNVSHPPNPVPDGPPHADPPTDPACFELVIDNDSGTYRPNCGLLPQLKRFLAANLPGIHIVALDCQHDGPLLDKLKREQRAAQKQEGDRVIGARATLSTSDLSRLADASEQGASDQPGLAEAVVQDAVQRGKLRTQQLRTLAKGRGDESEDKPWLSRPGSESIQTR